MEKLPMCRVCLAGDVRMYPVVNTNLRELYEKLTDNPFVTEDSRPMLACVFCCTKLKQCWRFQRKCMEAEELFAQMLHQGYEPNPLLNRGYPEFYYGFVQSPMQHISVGGECQTESVAIKEESPAICDTLDVIFEPKEEYHSDEIEQEIQPNSFAYVEVIPAQHSESDSEGDVPLMKIKTEVDEEKETFRKKRRAGDSQRAAVAKKTKLQLRRSRVEDVATEAQTEHEQSDTTVIQNPQNCALTTVTKCEDPLPYTAPILTNRSLDINCRNSSNNEDRKYIIYNKCIDGDDINRNTRLSFQEKPFKSNKFQRSSSVKTSLTNHSVKKPFKCDLCQLCFRYKSNLTHHVRTHTGEKRFKCNICQRCFSAKGTLTRHIRTHTGENPFKCDLCQHRFRDKGNLKNHMRTHTGEKPFKCHICQWCFSGKSSLTRHIRTHTGENPYKCDLCQRRFRAKDSLTRHIRTHNGEKPYKCDLCERCFIEKGKLTRHLRTHTGENPFKCDVCQRYFRQKCSLTRHIRTHTGDKPYKCDLCQHRFADKSKLKNHVRTQHGENPFKCDVCQRCLSDMCSLTRHIRTHTGEKPFKCEICQRCFSLKNKLTRHIRTHTGEKPFKCDHCQRCFSMKNNLINHIRRHTDAYR